MDFADLDVTGLARLDPPLVALDVAKNHRKDLTGELVFWFVDERQDRVDHLKQELSKIEMPSHFSVYAESGRFEEKVNTTLNGLDRENATLLPTFAFIDPFGFSGLPFTLISRLLGYKKCEVLITFMVDSINRFLEHPGPKIREHIDLIIGIRGIADQVTSAFDRISTLKELYHQQLKTRAEFVRFFEMRDVANRMIYCLFFASNNRLGHIKMKDAMWALDSSGAFSFSDATDPGQHVLFNQPDLISLEKNILNSFRGRDNIVCREIRLRIEDKTAFLAKHMREVLKTLESRGVIVVGNLKEDGMKRRRGSFPDDTLISFGKIQS